MKPKLRKVFYNTTLSQTISSCGEYLFAGNNFGEIFVYNIPQICANPVEQFNGFSGEDVVASNINVLPLQIFKASVDELSIRSLVFYNNFLICGTIGQITAFSWIKNRLTKKAWEIPISSQNNIGNQVMDINCLMLDEQNGILYAGCGDYNVYALNLDGGQMIRSFVAHTDFIHCIDIGSDRKSLYSASEDGSVKVWDKREANFVNQLEPWKDGRLARPQFGKWQGAVAVTDDWLICGGATNASLWHLRSMEVTTIFPFTRPIRVVGFLDDNIFVGGDFNRLCHFNFKGDSTAEIEVSSPSIYSVVSQLAPEKFLSIAGASNSLDVCTDFHYRDIVLNLYQTQKNVRN